MNSFDDLPLRETTHDIEEAATIAFRAAIDAGKLFIVQRADRNDYGTDVQIEARAGKAMTNIRAHVQLKGTNANVKANDSVRVRVARTNLNYLLAQSDSIYVCYHLPTDRLLVRYAEDVYREYEHGEADWTLQQTVTVNFTQRFDAEFQRQLNARLLVSGTSSRDRRLQWARTPPEQIPSLVRRASAIVEVPADLDQASKILAELYRTGNDTVISNSFAQFAAVLDVVPGAMDLAYMAEINLGINGSPFDKERVRQGVNVFYEAIASKNFDVGSLLYYVGNAWLALGEYQKARDVYQAALIKLNISELFRIAAQCCKNLGSTLEKLQEMDEARSMYERALELDPDLGEAHFALALWHRRKGDDFMSALRHLDQVIPHGGSALQASIVQGWRINLLLNTGNFERAFLEINILIGEANNLDWVWPWCARHAAHFGKMSASVAQMALQFWRIFLREHPSDTNAERERLLCLWRLRTARVTTQMDFEGFKLAVTRLIESGDRDPAYLWDRVGHWAQSEKDWGKAEAAYRKAYELKPERYGYCLGTALNFLKLYPEALLILLHQAKQHQPDAKSWFQVAKAREGVGDIEGGISAYRRALELDPDYELAWFNLGGLYWNSREIVLATQTWNEAVARFPKHRLARKLRREFPLLFHANTDR